MYTRSQETIRESAPQKKEEVKEEKGRFEIQEIEDLGD